MQSRKLRFCLSESLLLCSFADLWILKAEWSGAWNQQTIPDVLGLQELWSSFLDNTPTYLVFLTTAGALGFKGGVATTLGAVPVKMLEAISCGAVFMGANTYIGNAPNFMSKIYVG